MEIAAKAELAKRAAIGLAAVKTDRKNKALGAIAKALRKDSRRIIAANEADIKAAERQKLAAPLLKRLKFDEKKIEETIAGIKSLIKLPDPAGRLLSATELDKGLRLYKVSCPIGVIACIFESRPDALVQISTLCLKSGNAVILKGGSEALHTNKILAEIIDEASRKAGIPKGWLQLLETRADVRQMLSMDEYIDLVIPRGSNAFVRYIMDNTNIPVLGHSEGICHIYVNGKADLDMAIKITVDSKCQYVAVCNAAETLLVDRKIAKKFLPVIKTALEEKGVASTPSTSSGQAGSPQVEIRGCEKTRKIIKVKAATEKDWATEYLDYILSIKVVDGLDEAIEHINKYGSKHTDAIITSDKKAAEKFLEMVDSADVFWNCSTRFSDGYRYGLGAEVGISTNKIHARGPVGLEGLTIYKWKLYGNGQTVAEYASGKKRFTHKKLF